MNCLLIQTKCMVFRKKIQVIKPILYMNGSIIDSVENFNFLGLVLSSNLKWNCHIDHARFREP